MRSLTAAWLVLLAFCPDAAWAQTSGPGAEAAARTARSVPSVPATRAAAPHVDGRLDDEAWRQAPVIDTFTQRDPDEGQPATERTEVRIVHDQAALYVGARLHDRGEVRGPLGRRDMLLTSSDWFRVSFDTYRDRRTGVRFDVNPAGVRRDATLSTTGSTSSDFGGADGDLVWDAVWTAAAVVDEGGWTVEMRIPFSQLRFARTDEQTWGLQLERLIARKREHVLFSFTPKSELGGVPAFGDLTGLRGLRPGRPLEVLPYVLSAARASAASGNPFRDGREVDGGVGVDLRYGLTSNIALAATVNPDFGQVEVDPAVINLTAFETRFDEKRPFFVESANYFQFGRIIGPGNNAASLLYSRRIGRPPQIGLPGEHVDAPGFTSILGAAKIAGKTADGWSFGLLDAVTGRETGRFLDAAGGVGRAVVEPRTNHVAGRAMRELRGGLSTIGGMFTAVNRGLSNGPDRDALRSSAYAGGVDLLHEWDARRWAIAGFASASRVAGTAPSLLAVQRSSGHYFQRPDSETLEPDLAPRTMSGTAGTVQIRKQSGTHWTGDIWVGAITPGYHINDAGFLQRSDRISTGGALRYTERQPGRRLRSWSVNTSQNHSRNFDGDWFEKIVRASVNLTFLNYWALDVRTTWQRARMDDRFTRGGPVARVPGGWTASAGLTSDPRRPLTGTVEVDVSRTTSGGESRSVGAGLEVRTSPRWNLSFGPTLSRVRQDAQFVSAVTDPLMTATYGRRYIFAPLDQTELGLVTRVNYTFTADLSLEMYLQPLVSHGDYGAPMEFQTPGGYTFATYGAELGTVEAAGGRYTIDPDGAGPAAPFTAPDRSFTARSLRANAVLRWQYRPGSTLYLVWQQERLEDAPMARFGLGRALGGLLDGNGHNVLVLKLSYWLNP